MFTKNKLKMKLLIFSHFARNQRKEDARRKIDTALTIVFVVCLVGYAIWRYI